MRKTIFILAIAGAALALAACASQPKQQPKQQEVAQNQKVYKVCSSTAPIGSHIVKTYCTTMTPEQYKAYQKAQQKRAQNARDTMMRQQQNQPTGQGGPE